MAIRQSDIEEIRYIKRKNLEQEAKILGNMYRDQIHAQGIDCLYYKLDKTLMHTYKNVVDDNNLLFHAYGYIHNPSYSLSTYMIVHADVDNDVFNLNKFGLVPNMDLTFTFDRLDFACALAPKFGQYKEYEISAVQLCCTTQPDYPIIVNETIFQNIGYTEISSEVSAVLSDLSPGEHEAYCNIVGKGFAQTKFPVNDDIYASFMHRILNDDDIVTCFKLRYEVTNDVPDIYQIEGSITGSFLFYDVFDLRKYYDILHPDVGDIVTIDFPDGKSREQYEITEAVDKNLATDGINAFLHKYVWRCKARRYINSYEHMENNEANDQLEEIMKYDAATKEEITKQISKYKELAPGSAVTEDDVYGGYDNNDAPNYDKQKANINESSKPYIPDGMAECIIEFSSRSKLTTDGYDLWFINAAGEATQLSLNKSSAQQLSLDTQHAEIEWLKANDQNIVFNSLDGKSFMLALDEEAKPQEQQICLNSLFDLTFTDEKPIKNKNGQNFYKFKNCRTLLFATETSLFCHLPVGKTYKLA